MAELTNTKKEISPEDLYKETVLFVDYLSSRSKIETLPREQIYTLLNSIIEIFSEEMISAINLHLPLEGCNYSAKHSTNICILSIVIGDRLGYEWAKIFDLGLVALFHEIDLAKFSEVKIEKKDEQEIVKNMEKRLKEILGLYYQISTEQVEEKLSSQLLQEYQAIIKIVDVYDSLVRPRSYKQKIVPSDISTAILNATRTSELFNQRLAKILLEEVSFYPVGSIVKLNTGELARVIKVRRGFLLRPKVEVISDPQGRPFTQAFKELDLGSEPALHIQEGIILETLE